MNDIKLTFKDVDRYVERALDVDRDKYRNLVSKSEAPAKALADAIMCPDGSYQTDNSFSELILDLVWAAIDWQMYVDVLIYEQAELEETAEQIEQEQRDEHNRQIEAGLKRY